ncbi:MAG: rhodanese-like domain-containing protein [Methylovulum sp.]|nr:rhodanese-like domain-containing protein [Methylovulum sp.]
MDNYSRYLEFAANHYLLSLGLAVVTYLLIQEFFDTAFKKFANISPLLAVAKMNEENVVIIDVREPLEFTESHIADARNTPLSKLAEHLPSLEAYKKTPVLVACQTGARSATAGKQLAKAGFEQVFVITGGMAAWENDYKLPVKISKKKKA